MKLPRDLGGLELAKLLAKLGYEVVRQSGSHLRLTRSQGGEHHVAIPRHSPLRVGTLSSILSDIALHMRLSRQELLDRLFE